MKSYILIMVVATAFLSCDTKERLRLQAKSDSLTQVIAESKKAEIAMNEVGVMLDSIDISRHALRANILEGITYADYIKRLKDINTSIKISQAKIVSLEASANSSKRASSATIRRLKTELEEKSKEILELQLDVVALRDQNSGMYSKLLRQDSLLSSKDEVIRLKNADVASLQSLVTDLNEQNRIKVGNLYYAQAAALEVAAKRTKFAPNKKKETKREALELYKLAYSLGNADAQIRIQALEKDLA